MMAKVGVWCGRTFPEQVVAKEEPAEREREAEDQPVISDQAAHDAAGDVEEVEALALVSASA